MNDREALLQTILDNPDDEVPRLVYADCLEESGESANVARAEFIRLQCQLSRIALVDLKSPEIDPIRKRIDQLLREFEEIWLPWLKPNEPIRDWTWVKGFLSEITEINAKSFYQAAPVIFAEHPVRFLRPLEVAARELSMSHLLVKFQCFSQLRELDLSQSDVGIEGLTFGIDRATNLKCLTHLYLNETAFDDDSLGELVEGPLIQQLQLLDLRSTFISREGVQHLICAKGLEKLQKILLGDCEYIGESEKRRLRKRFGHRVKF